MEQFPCVKHCDKFWIYSSEKNPPLSCSRGTWGLMEGLSCTYYKLLLLYITIGRVIKTIISRRKLFWHWKKWYRGVCRLSQNFVTERDLSHLECSVTLSQAYKLLLFCVECNVSIILNNIWSYRLETVVISLW